MGAALDRSASFDVRGSLCVDSLLGVDFTDGLVLRRTGRGWSARVGRDLPRCAVTALRMRIGFDRLLRVGRRLAWLLHLPAVRIGGAVPRVLRVW
jgi:hypothetical protein